MFGPRSSPRLFVLLFLVALLFALPSAVLAQPPDPALSAPPLPLQPPPGAAVAPAAPGATAATLRVYLPAVAGPAAEDVPGVQRDQAVSLYRTHYMAYRSAADDWTGSIDQCEAGTLSPGYSEALELLVNYYRKMAGVQPITLDAGLNAKSQAAALMMSANEALDHVPPSSWRCYSRDGATAAGNSNLALYGGYGADFHGINLQMEDPGDGNWFVGHRRWILYPQTQQMGVGQIPPGASRMAATVLWVFDPHHLWDDRPPVRDGYVAWPPPGYVPAPTVYPRWSYSHPDADFSGATVTMRMDGAPVSVSSVKYDHAGYGERALIWTPALGSALTDGREHRVTVTVANFKQGGERTSTTYTVILFSPGA